MASFKHVIYSYKTENMPQLAETVEIFRNIKYLKIFLY